jgi:hypothetical protein
VLDGRPADVEGVLKDLRTIWSIDGALTSIVPNEEIRAILNEQRSCIETTQTTKLSQ